VGTTNPLMFQGSALAPSPKIDGPRQNATRTSQLIREISGKFVRGLFGCEARS